MSFVTDQESEPLIRYAAYAMANGMTKTCPNMSAIRYQEVSVMSYPYSEGLFVKI